VDDFGVGYSSFSYLRKFPLDALKVDRSFINDISSNPDNAMMLSALINIEKSLKHRVVAEGVGDRGTVAFPATRRLQRRPRLLFLPPHNCREVRRISGAQRCRIRRPLALRRQIPLTGDDALENKRLKAS
jgi:hypothetical protein